MLHYDKIRKIFDGTPVDQELPGTVVLVDTEEKNASTNITHVGSRVSYKTSTTAGEKYMDATKKDIILQPQPSDDVNDPLRWSQRKKNFQFTMLFIWSIFLAISVNWSGPFYTIWTKDLNCTLGQINVYQALNFLFLGVGCVFLQPTALKVGRRFVYLLCTLLGILGNAIGVRATNVYYLYGSGVILGFAAAPVDSLVEILSTDVFFIHERASRLSFLVLALYFGSDIGPVVATYLPSWNWAFLIQVIIFAGMFFILLFLLEDTTFSRENKHDHVETISSPKEAKTDAKAAGLIETRSVGSLESGTAAEPRSYLKRMQLIELEYNDKRSWWTLFVNPVYTACFPAVIWSGIVYGAQMMWLSLLSVTQSEIYTEYYNFSTSSTGLTNLAALGGSILGMAYGGWFVDWLSVTMARRNGGVMEAEFRLWAMIVPTVLNAGGILAYGLASVNRAPWEISVIIGQGFLGFAMSSSGPICLTYAIDSYPKLASDSLVLMLFVRNMIGCAFTFAIDPWMQRDGLTVTTWLMFMLSVVINGGFVAFLIWGKTWRQKTTRIYGILTS